MQAKPVKAIRGEVTILINRWDKTNIDTSKTYIISIPKYICRLVLMYCDTSLVCIYVWHLYLKINKSINSSMGWKFSALYINSLYSLVMPAVQVARRFLQVIALFIFAYQMQVAMKKYLSFSLTSFVETKGSY